MALVTGWLDSTISLIRQALSQAPPSRSSFRKLAMAEPCNDVPGWYLVQRRLSANELEFISEGNLAHGSGGHAVAFDVLEVTPMVSKSACGSPGTRHARGSNYVSGIRVLGRFWKAWPEDWRRREQIRC